MAAVQDALKAIADLQVVALDVVALAKDGVGFDMFGAIVKTIQDAAPLVNDLIALAPDVAELKTASAADYQSISQAALDMIFAISTAAGA